MNGLLYVGLLLFMCLIAALVYCCCRVSGMADQIAEKTEAWEGLRSPHKGFTLCPPN
jgi:hypothetical protein